MQLTLLASIALKSWTCQLVTHVENLLEKTETWHCSNCNKNLFSFTTTNNFKLYSLLSDRFYCNSDSNKSCLTLKPPKNLLHLSNEFNYFSTDINNAPEKVTNSNYYDITLK